MARPWYRAGDRVRVLPAAPLHAGEVFEVAWVRTLAADCGYGLRTGDIRSRGALFRPEWVERVQERDGNPCGAECDPDCGRSLGLCLHCAGQCDCWRTAHAR